MAASGDQHCAGFPVSRFWHWQWSGSVLPRETWAVVFPNREHPVPVGGMVRKQVRLAPVAPVSSTSQFQRLTPRGAITIFHGSFELMLRLRIKTFIYGQAEGTVRWENWSEARETSSGQNQAVSEEKRGFTHVYSRRQWS